MNEAASPAVIPAKAGIPELHGKEYFDFYVNDRGFDPRAKGRWQANYAAMLDNVFNLTGKKQSAESERRATALPAKSAVPTVVLDVGAACGAQSSALADLGLDVWAVEPEEYFVRASPFENLRGRLVLAGAQRLPFRRGFADFIQMHQVLEHIPAAECPGVFQELHRVARPDAIFYASLQVEKGVAHDPTDDVTHVNYQPMDWWLQLLADARWVPTNEFDAALNAEPMQRDNRWDYFVARWQL